MVDPTMTEFFARKVADWVRRSIEAGWLDRNFVSNPEWWGTWQKTVELALADAERDRDSVKAFGDALWAQVGFTCALTRPMPRKDSLLYGSFKELVDGLKMSYAEWVLTR